MDLAWLLVVPAYLLGTFPTAVLVGRHEGQAPDIDGVVYVNDGFGYPGELVTVEVTEAHDYDLVGRVVDRPERRAVASA